MLRIVSAGCVLILFVVACASQAGELKKYKTVEAYEVRPGILMMPKYAQDGRVCEIGLQRRHYSPEEIILDSAISRKELEQVLEELVPVSERGSRIQDFGANLATISGTGVATNTAYENVSIKYYARSVSDPLPTDIVVTVRWKNRKCN